MGKRSFGPKLKMEGLPKASKAKIKILTLPKEIETPFETGYGESGHLKWEMDIDLLEHPTQQPGKMVWQTTASVIRVEIMYLTNNSLDDLKLLLDDLKSCEWYVLCDEKGQYSLKEV